MMKIGIVVGVVVVVVILALAGLLVAGIGPFAKSTSGSGSGGGGAGTAVTFSQAASATSGSTGGVAGGPWKLVGGTAILLGTSESVNASTLTNQATGLGCGGKLLSGSSAITSVPASSVSLSSGDSAAWLVIYANSTGGVLEVADFGGTITPVLTATQFGVCGQIEALSLPSSYVDSPTAGATASAAGGSTYASAHPSYYTIYVLTPQVILTVVGGHLNVLPAAWEVELTNCDPAETTTATIDGKAPAQFHASINATTGALIRTVNTTSACIQTHTTGGGGGKPTLAGTIVVPLDFFESNNSNTAHPVFWNNATFVSYEATQMTLGEFTVAIENNTTGAAVSTVGITLDFYNATSLSAGHSDASYNFLTNTWSSNSPLIGKVSNHDYFELKSPRSLAGDKFVLTATSSAPVSGSISGKLAAVVF